MNLHSLLPGFIWSKDVHVCGWWNLLYKFSQACETNIFQIWPYSMTWLHIIMCSEKTHWILLFDLAQVCLSDFLYMKRFYQSSNTRSIILKVFKSFLVKCINLYGTVNVYSCKFIYHGSVYRRISICSIYNRLLKILLHNHDNAEPVYCE